MAKTQLRKSYDFTFLSGLSSSAMNAFTTGTIVTAYAIGLGAGNIVLGLLQAVQPISNLVHLPVSYFIEKGVSVKKMSVVSSLIARPFLLLAALAVFWAGHSFPLGMFIASYALSFFIGSIAGGAFLPWMKEFVRPCLVNRFFAHRIRYILLVRVLCMVGATAIIWGVQKYFPAFEIYAYAFFFFMAFLFGMYVTYTLWKIDDRPITPVAGKSFFEKMALTFKNASFKTLLMSLSLINFSMNFILPFTVVFILRRLDFSVSTALAFTILYQALDMLTINRWSLRTKKKGVNRILMEASCFYIVGILIFMVINQIFSSSIGLNMVALGVAYICVGVANAGLNLGINDAAVSYVPKKMASVYISINNTFRFFMAAAGPVVAGILLDTLKLWCNVHVQWTVFFGVAIALFVVSIALISRMTKIAAE